MSTIATVFGQSYIERPYRDRSEAPAELLVIELRSDGGARQMFQEFSGVQPEQLDGLLRQRSCEARRDHAPKWSSIDPYGTACACRTLRSGRNRRVPLAMMDQQHHQG